jgi:hypothetical protein
MSGFDYTLEVGRWNKGSIAKCGTLMRFVNSGKGTPRRKVVKKPHKSSGGDDKKLQTQLKKLNVQPIQAIEEVNMFKADGNVIHFAAPKGKNAVEEIMLLYCCRTSSTILSIVC